MRSINHSVTKLVSQKPDDLSRIFNFEHHKIDPCLAELDEVVSYIKSISIDLTAKRPNDNLDIVQSLGFLLFRWGAVVDMSSTSIVINQSKKSVMYSQANDSLYTFSYYVDILEFAHFSNLTWVNPTIESVERLKLLILKMLCLINKYPVLVSSSLHTKCLNRLFDVSGFTDAAQYLPQLVSSVFNTQSCMKILYGFESRQWGYQMLEMKRIYHLYTIFSALGCWHLVKSRIKVINIPNYAANTCALYNLSRYLGLDQISDLSSLNKLLEENCLVLNQWNIMADLPILAAGCSESIKRRILALRASNTYWTHQKDWLYNYMHYDMQFPNHHFIKVINRGSFNTTFKSIDRCQTNDFVVVFGFKDFFDKTHSNAQSQSYRQLQITPLSVVYKIIDYVLSQSNAHIIFANDWLAQLPEEEALKHISNAKYNNRFSLYTEFGETKDQARLNLLEFVYTKPNLVCIGDFCGCNDQLSLLAKKSIVLGHTSIATYQDYGHCYLFCDPHDASSEFLIDNSLPKVINPKFIDSPRIWISTTKLSNGIKRSNASHGLNSKVASLYFNLRSDEDIMGNFITSFESISRDNT